MAGVDATINLTLVDRVSAGIKRIQARFAALSARLKLDKLGAAFSNLGKRFGDLTSGIAASATRATTALGLLGASFAGLGYGAFSLVKNAADIGGELDDMSFKLGIGVEALQEYRYAAKLAGLEQATLDTGIQKLGLNAAEAAKGNKVLAKEFSRLGIRVKESNGQMRPTEKILDDTLVRLSKMKDPLQRNAAAFKLFGKSGVGLVQMLNGGVEGLRAARKEARELGIVMSQEAALAGAEFGDHLDRLTLRLQGFGTLLGVHLLPVISQLVESFNEWMSVNHKLISSTLTEWAAKFTRVLRALMDPTSEVRQGISRFFEVLQTGYSYIKPIVDLIGGPMIASLTALGIWIAGPAIYGITMMMAALLKLTAVTISFGAALLMNPIGVTIAAVALLAAGIAVLIKRWDEVKEYFTSGWDSVVAGFNVGFIEGIMELLRNFSPLVLISKAITECIDYLFGTNLTDAGAAMIDSLWAGLASSMDGLKSWFKESITSMLSWLPESVQTSLGFDPSKTAEAVQAATAPVSSVNRAVTSPASAVNNAVSAVTSPVRPAETSPAETSSGSLPPSRSAIGGGITEATQRWAAATRPTITATSSPSGGYATMPQNLSVGVLNVADLPALRNLTEAIRASQASGSDQGNSAAAQQPLHQQNNETNINAPMNLQLTINASETNATEVAKIARLEFERAGQKQLASIRASLSD